MFPSLVPTVPLLRRGPDEVQFGLDPDVAVVVRGLSETEIRALEGLDGLRPLAASVHAARSDRLEPLVRDLCARGLVADAGRRPPSVSAPTVVVGGETTTTELLADLLRHGGVRVRAGQAALDDLDLVQRGAPAVPEGYDVALVVTVAVGAVPPWNRPVAVPPPCLPVVLRPRSVVVGPFVDGTGPCLHCLDLTRAEHDESWALVLAQMDRLPRPATRTPLTALAASLASARILDRLSRERRALAARPGGLGHDPGADPGVTPTPDDTSTEMFLDPPRTLTRSWSRHPRCPRHSRNRHADGGT